MNTMFYSQFEQDKFLYESIFGDTYNGTFVDIGADNGVTINNTYFFETKLNWTGICIEPRVRPFNKLVKNRPGSSHWNCIISNSKVNKFLEVHGEGHILSGIPNFFSDHHKARIMNFIIDHNSSLSFENIHSFPLSYILKEENLYHINICSIDTEGNELDVLNSIDFNLFTFDVFCIENKPENDIESVRNFMNSVGFKLQCRLSIDDIFVRRELNLPLLEDKL